MKKQLFSLLLALVILFGLRPMAFAADNAAENAANRLYQLDLMKGTGVKSDGTPEFSLKDTTTREQATVMLIRLLGKEKEALEGSWKMPFTDISSWAVNYIGYAYEHGLTNGTEPNTFSGQDRITAAQYVTLVLRALGYSSETDFLWSSPWTLSDAIGLTDGRYSAVNNDAFARGDMAIISANALDVTVKGRAETLAETIGVLAPAAEDYLVRVLTDKELSGLKNATLDTLRAEISTIGDAVAFLEQFAPNGYSGFGEEIHLDIDFLYELHTRPEATTPQTYAAFAAWCITDDYEGIKYIVCVSELGGCRISPALALPVAGGYYIASPGEDTEAMNGNFHAMEAVVVDSLENLAKNIQFENENLVLQQVFVADANQLGLKFVVDEAGKSAAVSAGNAILTYQISREEIAAAEQLKRQERIRFAWDQLRYNWESYEMPASMMPTMSKTEVEQLVGKEIDTVAAACKTLGDCLYYYALSGFEGCSGDLSTSDESIGGGSLFWHYNYVPQVTFAKNTGNCGASSGLTSYLLQGDYDTVGMLGMTFAEGEGGGHFINYLHDGNAYYVFDIVNLLSAFHQSGFCFSSGDNLLDAARGWISRSGYPVRLMWAYQSFDGDVPVGWDWMNSHISYLPADYKERGEILIETPSEGYVYQWVTIGEEILKEIDQHRNQMD